MQVGALIEGARHIVWSSERKSERQLVWRRGADSHGDRGRGRKKGR